MSFINGSTVVIKEKPKMWDSGLGGKDPLILQYPFIGTVEKFTNNIVNISGYGFSIPYIKIGIDYEIY